jgi:hypothetical protein
MGHHIEGRESTFWNHALPGTGIDDREDRVPVGRSLQEQDKSG